MLGAFFIATDPVSGCTTPLGKIIFAAGVAALTWIIRSFGGYPDGMAFAILLMNLLRAADRHGHPAEGVRPQGETRPMSDAQPTPGPDLIPPAPPRPGALRISLRTAMILLVFTLVFTTLMAEVYQITQPVLQASALDAKRRLIGEVLPADSYDNDLLEDAIELPPAPEFGLDRTDAALSRPQGGQAGRNGTRGRRARWLLRRDPPHPRDTCRWPPAAVRITQHKETPGLGDYIDPKKDRNKESPWISQFDNRDFTSTPREKWSVKKDGGAFDQHTGATISARAVTKATGRALGWALDRSYRLYDIPAGGRYEEKTP